MRFPATKPISCIFSLVALCSVASAQFQVRELNTDGQPLDGHYEAYSYLTSSVDQMWLEDIGAASVADFNDFSQNMSRINIGKSAGAFPDVFNGDFLLGTDYAIDVRAQVTIPAGTWTVAINADDGGQLTVPGVTFESTYGQWDPLGKGGPSQIWHQGNSDGSSTGATFTVGAGGIDTLLHASMHQRDATDSFELVIRPGGVGDSNPMPGEAGWELLSNGAHGWQVTPTNDLPAMGANGLPLGSGIAQPLLVTPSSDALSLGNYVPDLAVAITTNGDGTATEAGLSQRWFNVGTSDDLSGLVSSMVVADASSVRFQDEPTWFSGSSTAQAGIQTYPAGINGAAGLSAAAGADNDQYTAWLSGEINLSAGETRFRFGGEGYKYVAIDTGGNGVAGDQVGEILFKDGEGVESGASNNGGAMANVAIANANADGWYKIDMIASNDEGADSAILYWDEGQEEAFPLAAPFGDTSGFAAADYAVPSDKLRSVSREGDIEDAMLVAGFEGAVLNLEVSSAFLDADRVVLQDPSLTTVIDLTGATINILALDGEQLTEGDQWVLFAADSVIGLDAATITAPSGMDIGALVAGTSNRITFGASTPPVVEPPVVEPPIVEPPVVEPPIVDPPAGLPADFDGDGNVGFSDFLTLSANFGQPGMSVDGDSDGDGLVGFSDFLTLSSTFGQSGIAVAAVPEPAGLTLSALMCLLMGFARKRRQSS